MEYTYYQKYINFLKKYNIFNKEILEYIRKNSMHFNYMEEEKREFIGCFYIQDKNNTLQKIHICIPYIDSDLTVLINIHEYIHILSSYPYINRKFKLSKEVETLPIFYEQLYYLDNQSEYLKKEMIKLSNQILNSDQIEYKIALYCKEELLDYYSKEKPHFKKLQRKAKQMSNKYINK